MKTRRLVMLTLTAAACTAILAAAGSSAPPTPAETVKSYIKRLQDNKPYAAVGELFDTKDFVTRIYGTDLNSLDPSEQIYVRELIQVFLKTSVGQGQTALADALKQSRIADPAVTMVSPTEAVVKLAIIAPNGSDQTREYRLVRQGSLWMIVDMLPVAQMLHEQWEEAKQDGVTPIEFAEIGVHAMLGERSLAVEERVARRDRANLNKEADAAREKVRADTAAAQRELQRLQQQKKK